MQRDRAHKLADLVTDLNEMLTDYSAIFEINAGSQNAKRPVDYKVSISDGDYSYIYHEGNRNVRYWVGHCMNYHYDPGLLKAEKHLKLLIDEVKGDKANDTV